jgi:type IV secretory pathway TrbL component
MPLPSRKELTAQLQSALGALLEKYAIEGKKSRKLTEKAAGKLAKALKKNAGKQELKKASARAENGVELKKAKKPKKNGSGKEGKEESAVPDAARPMPAGAEQKAGKTENNKTPALANAL